MLKTDIEQANLFSDDEQQENLGDVAGSSWHDGAALWSTDWTAETIIRQLEKGNIELNPRWQRRGAWNEERQSQFIESLFLGLPVPQIILAENKSRKGTYIVIDGKQRLLSLARFSGISREFGTLELKGLQELSNFNQKKLADIVSDDDEAELLSSFENSAIRTVIIRNWHSDRYLYSVFLRINTGSVPLSAQELRQALSPGQFSNFVDDYSVQSEQIKRLLNLKTPDFRMRDAELVLRFFAYYFFSHLYSGNLKLFLDNTTAELNSRWKTMSAHVQKAGDELAASIDFTTDIFGANAMKKWNGVNYENRINRAVFDVMSQYFSSEKNRLYLANHKEEVELAFKKLCTDDRDFMAAIESTTKSSDANKNRFWIWGERLEHITQGKIEPINVGH